MQFHGKTCEIFRRDSVGFYVEYSIKLPRKRRVPRTLHGVFHEVSIENFTCFPHGILWGIKPVPLSCYN